MEPIEQAGLCNPANGIFILKASDRLVISDGVTEGLDTIGVMLPATPLHFALVRGTGYPLVVTSGNLEGDPLAFEGDVARRELCDMADLWLDHDRPIVRPVDDSVCRVIAGKLATVRLARGLAPLALELETRPMLALGGHQKVAIALSNGAQSVLGPHVGDLETEAARVRYLNHIAAMHQLYGFAPEFLVCDEHPDYFSTRWAATQPLPTIAVQHHHAHVAAAMLEQNWLKREVLGIAWDGTGYGPDGTIWGGEFLIATATEYSRAACLRPFVLPGGEAAIRQPWRVAVSLVHQAAGAEKAARLEFRGVAPREVERVVALLCKARIGPRTSSAGRLFDGVAALILDIATTQFEGQAAMLLEATCDATCDSQYSLPFSAQAPAQLDWRALIRSVLADHASRRPTGIIAMRFHRALAAGIAAVADSFPELPAVLCGGCFQNKVLTELVAECFQDGRPLATPGLTPCGDGGLAAGQLAVAAARLAGGWTSCA
jgi:hydrogenase maturation protein HypF